MMLLLSMCFVYLYNSNVHGKCYAWVSIWNEKSCPRDLPNAQGNAIYSVHQSMRDEDQ